MSRKRVETFDLGLWRVFTSGVRAKQASEELSPGREPHWFGWSRPLDLAMADSLTVMTPSRIFEMVLRRTMMREGRGSRRRPCQACLGLPHWPFSTRGGDSRKLPGKEVFEEDCGVDEVDPCPYGVGDPVGAWA